MLLITYDISDNKLRSHFAKMLSKYGHRIQYSVFEIRNSKRVLGNILIEIEKKFKKRFQGTDSVVIMPLCKCCKEKTVKMGYAETEDRDIVFL